MKLPAPALRGRDYKRRRAAASRDLSGATARSKHCVKALEQARAGHGQVVAVVGEPGVGKSRLFYEFTHSHRHEGCLIVESGRSLTVKLLLTCR